MNPGLRRRVVGLSERALGTVDRRNVDDPTQPRSTMPSATCLVMLNRLSRLVRRTASQLALSIFPEGHVASDAGVVHQHIDLAKPLRTSPTAFAQESKSATSRATATMS